jgi:small-conductance mechanosensitive channel
VFSVHPWLGLTDGPRGTIRHLLVVAITLNVGWVFLRAIRIFEEVVAHKASEAGSLRARAAYTQVHGLGNVARFLIGLTTLGLVLLSFSAVREMGVSILASAGVVGIAVGFAAQKTLSAVVSGLVIAVAQPIRAASSSPSTTFWRSPSRTGRVPPRRCARTPSSFSTTRRHST